MESCLNCGEEFIPKERFKNFCSWSCKRTFKISEDKILEIVTNNKTLGKYKLFKKYPFVRKHCINFNIVHKINEIVVFKKKLKTYEECVEVAKKCKTMKEFREEHTNYYNTCHRKGYHDILESLERSDKNLSKRCVYEYSFSDNSIYIGLTWDFNERHREHTVYKTGSSVGQHIIKTGLIPTHRIVLNYTDEDTAHNFEIQLVNYYKRKGYKILNKIKAGGLGGKEKYTKEEIHKEALKYSGRKEFMMNASGYYRRAIKEGWLDEVCTHMKTTKELNLYWTEERVKNLIDKYNITKRCGKGGLKDINSPAYTSARKQGFLKKLLPHSRSDISDSISVGSKKNYLTVIKKYRGEINNFGNSPTMVDCKCDCGRLRTINLTQFIHGKIKSCGCMNYIRKDKYFP